MKQSLYNRGASLIVTARGFLLISFAACALAQAPPSNPLIGQGRGIDHVGVGVRDLTRAQHDYEQMGFNVSQGGHFPDGVFNGIIYFEGETYLELLSVKESQEAKSDASDIADFAKKHEGAMFLGLNVSSAKSAGAYLRAQDFDVSGPEPGGIMKEGETKPPPSQWYTVGTADKPAPNKKTFTVPIFLIEYLSSNRWDKVRAERRAVHPNTAIGIHAVWFAVGDLNAQLRTLGDAGFAVESRDANLLGVHGRELKAGAGVMVLLGGNDRTGLLKRYLSDHDDGIIALSIEVSESVQSPQNSRVFHWEKVETLQRHLRPKFLATPRGDAWSVARNVSALIWRIPPLRADAGMVGVTSRLHSLTLKLGGRA